MVQKEQTIAKRVERSGIGLHSGIATQVRLLPADSSQGRYFVRTDLPGHPHILANISKVHTTTLSTELCQNSATIRTVEHLLAALAATGVDNVRIEIDGPEVPLLDGSAYEWIKAIGEIVPSTPECYKPTVGVVKAPIWIYHGDAFVAAIPTGETRFTYGIDFGYPAIGNQWHSWGIQEDNFATEIAPARTFGLAEQIEQLRSAGLIQGGSLDNALVCSQEGWLNPPLRFANEPARHKLLDLIGDLSLLGAFPVAHFLAYKASHKLHIQLAQVLAKQMSESLLTHS